MTYGRAPTRLYEEQLVVVHTGIAKIWSSRPLHPELNIKRTLFDALAVLLLASAIVPAPAFGMALAYIDPLSGSVLLQLLAAGVLGALFSTKSFLARMRGYARNIWTKLTKR